MTSQINLEDIYTELNNLLKDVCSFLITEAQNGALSAKAKNEAEKLVSRSRQQVEIVTKLSIIQESTNSNYPYLQMLPGGIEEPICEYVAADYYEPQHYEESYAPVDNEAISSPSPATTVIEDFCLYADSPLYKIEDKSVKYGPLCRKERYLFIEQKKQYLVALVGYWLLIYGLNKKDQKPLQILNLSNYTAKPIEQRKDPAFEICADNEKTYEFIARSVKDMEQWIIAINYKKHICTNSRNLPEIPQVTITLDNSDKNSNQINSKIYGSEDDDIYASVEDFGKPEIPKPIQLPAPDTEEFPKLPPRSNKEIPISPKVPTIDNTYNNLQKSETEENDDTNSEYDFVQCSDTQKQNNTEEEQLEIYDELKVTETVNINVKIPSLLNINTINDNSDSIDTEQEELDDYDTIKPMSKIPIKIKDEIKMNVSKKENIQNDEDLVDYDELKPICQLNDQKRTLSKPQLQKDEELENYDELKLFPCKFNQSIQVTSEEVLEDYDILIPVPQNYKSKQNTPRHSSTPKEEEKLEDYEVQPIPQGSSNKIILKVQITSPEGEELLNNDELKPIPNINLSQQKSTPEKDAGDNKPSNESKPTKQMESTSKKSENNTEMKPVKLSKPIKKFWEKRTSEITKKEADSLKKETVSPKKEADSIKKETLSPKKEADTDDDESKKSVASIKSKFNVQSSPTASHKPPITSPKPKPKPQTLLNKFPSFSKNKNSKDEDCNSKVQNIRQQLETSLSFRSQNK